MLNFTIRSGVTWQDGTAFTPEDVAFSYEFTRHCGSGIAWNFAAVQNLNSTGVDGNVVWVKMNVAKPLTGQEDFGMLPIIPKHIWDTKFPTWQTWFDETTGTWAPVTTREVVRNWQYFEEAWTGPNLIPMTKAFGTGAWIFKSHVTGESINYDRYTGHYKTAAAVSAIVANDFWKYMGDVNKNFRVDGTDLSRLDLAFGSFDPPSDPACDFDGNDAVDELDHLLLSKNFGRMA
jgi:ABC-type transport system substrate-binding protein